MNDKIQDFNPNVVDEIRTVFDAGKEIDRIDIEDLFIAIDYWRHGQQKEHELAIQAFNAQKLSFFVYQLKSERTMNTSLLLKDQLNNYIFGLVGEVGEVVDLLKKFFYHGHEVDSNRLKSELGDILWYVSAVASLFNINLQDIAQGNIEKLEKRYPNGFSSEASIKREKEGG